jgi:hypothetical protein
MPKSGLDLHCCTRLTTFWEKVVCRLTAEMKVLTDEKMGAIRSFSAVSVCLNPFTCTFHIILKSFEQDSNLGAVVDVIIW